MQAHEIEDRLTKHFSKAQIKAKDMTGTGDHWQVEIESPDFEGKSLIEQHQMVYSALGEWMKKEIHALSLNTSTPKS